MTTITIAHEIVRQTVQALDLGIPISRGSYLHNQLRAALPERAETFTADSIAHTQVAWQMGYEAGKAEEQAERVDQYRKGFIAGQIDMRDREQAEPVESDEAARLVDDLCLLHLGWKSDAEFDLYRAAMARVVARAFRARSERC